MEPEAARAGSLHNATSAYKQSALSRVISYRDTPIELRFDMTARLRQGFPCGLEIGATPVSALRGIERGIEHGSEDCPVQRPERPADLGGRRTGTYCGPRAPRAHRRAGRDRGALLGGRGHRAGRAAGGG